MVRLVFAGVCMVTLCLFASLPWSLGGEKDDDARQTTTNVLELVNQFRKEQGLKPLVLNDKLTASAQKHADALTDLGKPGDDGNNPHILNGKRAVDRAAAAGYKWIIGGENIALSASKDLAKAAVENWKNSKGHRENMLGPKFKDTGIGVGRRKDGQVWIVQVFATRK